VPRHGKRSVEPEPTSDLRGVTNGVTGWVFSAASRNHPHVGPVGAAEAVNPGWIVGLIVALNP
jgi:hypothetical protein